jgi:hypothetical protein
MNRYAHEKYGNACIHCGNEGSYAPDGAFCEARQRRHDAFVAAALMGEMVFAGASLSAACVGGQLSGQDPRMLAEALRLRIQQDAAHDAVAYADAVMAELAKAKP